MEYKFSKLISAYDEGNGWLRLYNSQKGLESLIRVRKEKFERIKQNLENDGIFQNTADKTFQKLAELEYIIPYSGDEEKALEVKIGEQIYEPVLRLIILPTEKCSFRCRYCYEKFENGKMYDQLQNAIINYVKNNIHNYARMEVRWFGGEPLEALDVIENLSKNFITICKMAHRNYEASITTNGYYLTYDVFQRLYRLSVRNYQVTIDGLKTEHDQQRYLAGGIGTFEQIVNNLVDIKTRCKSRIPNFTIRTNFNKESIKRLDEYLYFFSEKFGDDDRFGFSLQRASDWGGERVKKIKDSLITEQTYEDLLTKILNQNVRLNISPHAALFAREECVCYAGKKNSYVIGSNGQIYKCTADFNMEANNIGRITEEGKFVIDKYKEEKWLTAWLHAGELHECTKCRFEGACLRMSCPSSVIKEIGENGSCLLEKEYTSLFLGLFEKHWFYEIGKEQQ